MIVIACLLRELRLLCSSVSLMMLLNLCDNVTFGMSENHNIGMGGCRPIVDVVQSYARLLGCAIALKCNVQ